MHVQLPAFNTCTLGSKAYRPNIGLVRAFVVLANLKSVTFVAVRGSQPAAYHLLQLVSSMWSTPLQGYYSIFNLRKRIHSSQKYDKLFKGITGFYRG